MSDNSHNQENEIDILETIGILLDGWKWIVVFTILFAVGGVVVAQYLRSEYQVNALLQIDSQGNKTSSAALGDVASLFDVASPAETEIELIKSRMVLGSVVDKLGLMYRTAPSGILDRLLHHEGRLELAEFQYTVPPDAKNDPWLIEAMDSVHYQLYSPDGEKILDGEVGKTSVGSWRGAAVRISPLRMDASAGKQFYAWAIDTLSAISMVLGNLSVAEKGKKTGVLEVTYQDNYSDRAALILNEIANTYLRQNVEQRSAEAQKTLEFLKSQLPAIKEKLDSSEQVLNLYRYQTGTVDLSAEARLVLEKQVGLEKEFLELQQKKEEALRLFKGDHPTILAIDSQMTRLRKASGVATSQVKELPLTQQEVLRMSRDVQVNTAQYTDMLNNVQQLEVVKAGQVGTVRIVDYARQTLKPVKPQKKIILVGSLLFGAFFGAGLVLLIHSLRKGVRDAALLEKETGISVYAKIPTSGVERRIRPRKGERRKLLVEEATDDISVEGLRSLRTALEFGLQEAKGKNIVSITGLRPGVGKSFIASNLAALFAQTGVKTLLIDADLRRGRLHHHFGYTRDNGFSELLADKISAEKAIRPTGIKNFDLITAGMVPPNPAELLGSLRLTNLLQQLSTSYELVLVDTPPLMLVTDPVLVCKHSGRTLLVLEYNAHSMSEIQEALNTLGRSGAENRAIVLNKYEHGGGKYYRYRYGYKYGRYYKYGYK